MLIKFCYVKVGFRAAEKLKVLYDIASYFILF